MLVSVSIPAPVLITDPDPEIAPPSTALVDCASSSVPVRPMPPVSPDVAFSSANRLAPPVKSIASAWPERPLPPAIVPPLRIVIPAPDIPTPPSPAVPSGPALRSGVGARPIVRCPRPAEPPLPPVIEPQVEQGSAACGEQYADPSIAPAPASSANGRGAVSTAKASVASIAANAALNGPNIVAAAGASHDRPETPGATSTSSTSEVVRAAAATIASVASSIARQQHSIVDDAGAGAVSVKSAEAATTAATIVDQISALSVAPVGMACRAAGDWRISGKGTSGPPISPAGTASAAARTQTSISARIACEASAPGATVSAEARSKAAPGTSISKGWNRGICRSRDRHGGQERALKSVHVPHQLSPTVTAALAGTT